MLLPLLGSQQNSSASKELVLWQDIKCWWGNWVDILDAGIPDIEHFVPPTTQSVFKAQPTLKTHDNK